jgi:hypothetical protein
MTNPCPRWMIHNPISSLVGFETPLATQRQYAVVQVRQMLSIRMNDVCYERRFLAVVHPCVNETNVGLETS